MNVVDNKGGVKLLEVGSNMGFFPPPGMFPGDSAMMGGQGFPPFPPGMFPGGGAGMPEGFEFPPKGNFPPPMPMRRIVSDFSEDNLPNYDRR